MKQTVWLCAIMACAASMTTTARGSVVDPDTVEPSPSPRANAWNVIYEGLGYYDILESEHFDGGVSKTPVGQIMIDVNGSPFIVWCVDRPHTTGSGVFTLDSVTTLKRWREISYLYDHYAEGIDSNASAAALQAAIWECLYEASDQPLSLDGPEGMYWLDNTSHIPKMDLIIDAGNAMLASLVHMPDDYTSPAELFVLHSPIYQDLLIATFGTPVPEPLTMTLLTLGGTSLLMRKRRGDAQTR